MTLAVLEVHSKHIWHRYLISVPQRPIIWCQFITRTLSGDIEVVWIMFSYKVTICKKPKRKLKTRRWRWIPKICWFQSSCPSGASNFASLLNFPNRIICHSNNTKKELSSPQMWKDYVKGFTASGKTTSEADLFNPWGAAGAAWAAGKRQSGLEQEPQNLPRRWSKWFRLFSVRNKRVDSKKNEKKIFSHCPASSGHQRGHYFKKTAGELNPLLNQNPPSLDNSSKTEERNGLFQP